MLNKGFLIGNVGIIEDIKNTNGVKISICVSYKYTDKNGIVQEKSNWFYVNFFNSNIVKVIRQYCVKGMKVFTEYKLDTKEKYINIVGTQFEILSYKEKTNEQQQNQQQEVQNNFNQYNVNQQQEVYDDDDEIPFL